MINLDALFGDNAILEGGSELGVGILLHNIVMILLLLPSQEGIERETR